MIIQPFLKQAGADSEWEFFVTDDLPGHTQLAPQPLDEALDAEAGEVVEEDRHWGPVYSRSALAGRATFARGMVDDGGKSHESAHVRVLTNPLFKGRGVAGLIMEFLKVQAKAEGLTRLVAHSPDTPGCPEASFLNRNGFEELSRDNEDGRIRWIWRLRDRSGNSL